ncbi:MAG: hypothetical protein MR011_06090 [Lachnospiraceae bacterium]|nr:hypothetical protein [Lachnospiraceae bacterium]
MNEAKCERVPIKVAAEVLGVSVLCVQERMRRGIYPIGQFISKKQSGKRYDRFEIYKPKLEAFIGKELKL